MPVWCLMIAAADDRGVFVLQEEVVFGVSDLVRCLFDGETFLEIFLD